MRKLLAAPACLAVCLIAAPGAGAVPMVGTDGTTLIQFDSASPGSATSTPVTGLIGGDVLRDIDYRPSDSGLYAISSGSRLLQDQHRHGCCDAGGRRRLLRSQRKRFRD